MKIGLITIHWANNYGASLQTYATVAALKKYGDVTLIDYRTPHAAKGMQLIRFGTKGRDFLRMGKDIFRLIPRYKVINKFKKFTESMPLSNQNIGDSDFSELVKEFDVFVCGSDQIWNPSILGENNEIDPHFMLDFVENKRKLSYASSVGSYKYTSQQQTQVKNLLNSFGAISVRENDTAVYLQNILGREITTVVDPTLLHTRAEWLAFFDIRDVDPDTKYVLVYGLKKDRLLKNIVELYKSLTGMDVIVIDQDPFINFKADYHIKDASPIDFVRLFSQASYVITNSFHGVCFAVNFNKNFVVTVPPGSPNRITNILEKTGLIDRMVTNVEDAKELSMFVDFTEANNLLESERASALRFLDNNMKAL